MKFVKWIFEGKSYCLNCGDWLFYQSYDRLYDDIPFHKYKIYFNFYTNKYNIFIGSILQNII